MKYTFDLTELKRILESSKVWNHYVLTKHFVLSKYSNLTTNQTREISTDLINYARNINSKYKLEMNVIRYN